jgi:hypothetical protein
MAAVLLAATAAPLAAAELATPVGNGSEPAAPWRFKGLPQQAKPATRFSIVDLDQQPVLRVEADGAYGNLVHELADARAGTLAWRWRVDRPLHGADLRRRTGDDIALKVCALFDMPLAQVPFLERQLLRIASARSGERLPTATLCYIWDAQLPQGTLLHSAYTHRVRYISAAPGMLQRWSEARHDLAADFLRAFGDEAREVPPLAAVLVGADSDNTGSLSLGYVSDLRFIP